MQLPEQTPDKTENSAHVMAENSVKTKIVNIIPNGRPILDSLEIFQGTREVAIRHGSEFYRLRLTKSGKLILHK